VTDKSSDNKLSEAKPVGSGFGGEFSARLQVLNLTSTLYTLIFDQWEGPELSPRQVEEIKAATGARGVLFFRGTIDIGD
jgi:hypothetical protein